MRLVHLSFAELLILAGVLSAVLARPITLGAFNEERRVWPGSLSVQAGRTSDASELHDLRPQVEKRVSNESLPHLPFRDYPSERDDERAESEAIRSLVTVFRDLRQGEKRVESASD
ncbi:hypothetical protein K438DRAFT_1771101 [Mycena galopus ATCC 62051]|nr:hypothetical protein K438DRAFT_1771101 [Mycena galopus ATCC 62051]